jgi:hypothetical protein
MTGSAAGSGAWGAWAGRPTTRRTRGGEARGLAIAPAVALLVACGTKEDPAPRRPVAELRTAAAAQAAPEDGGAPAPTDGGDDAAPDASAPDAGPYLGEVPVSMKRLVLDGVRTGIEVPVFEVADARLRTRLEARVRAEVGGEYFGDRGLTGRCTPTLATERMVALHCVAGIEEHSGGVLLNATAVILRIAGGQLHRVDPEELFVEGADLDAFYEQVCVRTWQQEEALSLDDAEERCAENYAYAASPGIEGLHVVWTYDVGNARDTLVPWKEVREHLAPAGPITDVPGALDATPQRTPITAALAPVPGLVSAQFLSPPMPLGELAHTLRHVPTYGRLFSFIPVDGGLYRLGRRGVVPPNTPTPPLLVPLLAALGSQPEPAPWPPSRLEIGAMRVYETTTIRARPAPSAPAVGVLPSDTVGLRLRGRIDGVDSVIAREPSVWTYVVVAPDLAGWVRGDTLDLGATEREAATTELFLASVPDASREPARRTLRVAPLGPFALPGDRRAQRVVLVIGTDDAVERTYAALVDVPLPRATPGVDAGVPPPPSVLLFVAAEGTLVDARVVDTTPPSTRPPGPAMLVLGTRVRSDPPGVVRWRGHVPELGEVLSADVPSGPGAPRADAREVRLGEAPRGGTYAPFAVVGPRNARVAYTWNGERVAPPAPTAPAPAAPTPAPTAPAPAASGSTPTP